MAQLTQDVRERIAGTGIWFVASTNPDGSPHVSPMWVDLDGDHLWFNTSIGRVKERNLRNDPRICLSNADTANPFDRVQLHGRVVRFVEGEQAKADMDRLAHKYLGTPYEWLLPDEQRITVVVELERVRRIVGVEPFGPAK
ncbi:PPOX class F420-dependent oxidoreductase [Streptomyces sp. Da 82-17]|uniref:PPOX class F420-dependent oxidoreductase n=1 Tax=Streptomyces sp. Da 82-17 TaxID=3377116 RepID=UPI0038D42712